MKKFLVMLAIIFAGNFFAASVHAEIKTYEEVGEFLIADESLEYAKNQAKLNGARNIAEQIYLKIQSQSSAKKSALVRDEIIARSESLLHIIDVKYKIEPSGENILLKAFVTAEVDTEEIEKVIKNLEERQ